MDIQVDSFELEANAHPDENHSTLSDYIDSKNIVVITPSGGGVIKK